MVYNFTSKPFSASFPMLLAKDYKVEKNTPRQLVTQITTFRVPKSEFFSDLEKALQVMYY